MFTGIVEEIGTIRAVHATSGDLRVVVAATRVLEGVALGDSIAVSGCCLTVVAFDEATFDVELSRETVTKTSPRWREGARVNLERATRMGDRLGGHLVSGHVEGTGRVRAVDAVPGAHVVTVRAPDALARYLIPKGSVTVDGVSLTVVDVGGPGGSSDTLASTDFTLWLIPHTLAVTTLGDLRAGDHVNLEADLIAKYLERLAGMGAVREAHSTRTDAEGTHAGLPGPHVPNPPPPPPPTEPPMPRPPEPPPAPPIPEPPVPGPPRSSGERGGGA
ncbi:MAG: riboflavin synthase [Trueperaceae bacterium]|nr:riboflavin synthase [Trueperaceae bacterium]